MSHWSSEHRKNSLEMRMHAKSARTVRIMSDHQLTTVDSPAYIHLPRPHALILYSLCAPCARNKSPTTWASRRRFNDDAARTYRIKVGDAPPRTRGRAGCGQGVKGGEGECGSRDT